MHITVSLCKVRVAGGRQGVRRWSTWTTLPEYHLPLPLTEAVVFVWMEDVSSPLCDVLTCLGHGCFFLFGLVQVLDTPEGSFSFPVSDFVHVNAAFVQGVTKLVEIL